MAEWHDGYVTELTYTQGYYRELSPLAMRFALQCAGFKAPPAQGFNYCELGFGQGVSLNVHAAAHPDSRFWGNDFNPAHARHAGALAQAAGTNLNVLEASFAELLQRTDLPQFDYIGLHGIWSWVSDENRAHLVEFCRRYLKSGGVLYISYNCLPGWSQAAPLRHLMNEYAQRQTAVGDGMSRRLDAALDFTRQLAGLNLGYFAGTGVLQEKLEGMSRQSRNYLAHEYMNQDWRLMYFSEVAECLKAAKLDFAASAAVNEQLDGLRIPAAGMNLLNGISDPVMRQTVRDYLLNQQFRRDLFIRGGERMTSAEQKRVLDEWRFTLLRPLAQLLEEKPRSVVAPEVRKAILEKLAEEGECSLSDLSGHCAAHPLLLVRQVLMVMVGGGELALCQPAAVAAAAAEACQALNRVWCDRAGEGGESAYLASPRTAGAVQLGALQQLMLGVYESACANEASALAARAWEKLAALGQRVVTGGKTCESPEDNMAALTRIAAEFLARDLPLMQRLGCCRINVS